jgi:HAD superfamily hydrolase (TIGR01509 family)
MSRLVLFVDDGGVLNDGHARGPAWEQLTAAFFAPQLGGPPEAWIKANRLMHRRLADSYARELRGRVDLAAGPLYRERQRAWLIGMCELVGIASPSHDDCLALAERAVQAIAPRAIAPLPGAIEAIRALRAAGCALHTASGEWSVALDGYLTGMGIRQCFGRLYGPDLVGTLKEGPAYYRRLFEDADVDPDRALVLDDMPLAVAWAREAGARAVLVGAVSPPADRPPPTIPGIAALPERLAEFEG